MHLLKNSAKERIYQWFKGTVPLGMVINHIDGDKLNNNLSNLEAVSKGDNSRHARDNLPNKSYKLTIEQVRLIRLNVNNLSISELATLNKVSESSINNILKHITWSNGTKKAKYTPNPLSTKELINMIIKDENYIIKENGYIFTYFDAKASKLTPELRIVAQITIKKNYKVIRYKKKTLQLHHVIFAKFNGPLIENMVINHKDGDPSNNHIQNLEQITKSQNIFHAHRTLKRGNFKISLQEVRKIRQDYQTKIKFNYRDYDSFGIHPGHLDRIIRNKSVIDESYIYISRKKLGLPNPEIPMWVLRKEFRKDNAKTPIE